VSTTASQNCIAPGRNSEEGIDSRLGGDGLGGDVNEISTFLREIIFGLPTHISELKFSRLTSYQ
jgi:hypothetical protein